jgi:hypothetical protein
MNRATHVNPSKRYQSVNEFRDELHDATMPGTQRLKSNGNAQSISQSSSPFSFPDNSSSSNNKTDAPVTTFVVPPPTFHASTKLSQGLDSRTASAHPRIVVPVTNNVASQSAARTDDVNKHSADSRSSPAMNDLAHANLPAKNSGRSRRWLVALVLISLFAIMLLATHSYVSNLRNSNSSSGNSTSNAALNPVIGREFIANTDVNLRSNPNRNSSQIGMADKGSRVRVVNVSGGWYQVEVLERRRPKEQPGADRGWLDRDFLRDNESRDPRQSFKTLSVGQ